MILHRYTSDQTLWVYLNAIKMSKRKLNWSLLRTQYMIALLVVLVQLFVSHPASIYLYNQFQGLCPSGLPLSHQHSYPTLSSALNIFSDGVFLLLLKTALLGLKQVLSNFYAIGFLWRRCHRHLKSGPPFFLIWSLPRLWYRSLSGSIYLNHLSICYNISCYNSLVLITLVFRSSCRITYIYIYINIWNNRQNTKRESSLRLDILQ